MTFRTAAICFAGIATLGIARFTMIDHASSETSMLPRPTKTTRPVGLTSVTQAEALRMGPADWIQHFRKDRLSSSQTRKAVARLSEELQQMLAQGADPQGEDAKVYTDAMLSLLSSRWEE